jgi:flagellar operon protein
MQVRNGAFPSIEQVTGQYINESAASRKATTADGQSFLDILQKTESGMKEPELRFSKHAGERLAQRDINLTQEQLTRLEDGAQKASAKGIKESLVLMDGMAFIVNTSSNLVITAMSQSGTEDNVYTNIDGAVII